MARLDDIDTDAVVRKYLERRVVVDREDKGADSADEVAAVLEAVALAFLLYPQAALTFVLRAKNVLQQILDADLAMVAYLLAAIDDVQNPNDPIEDTSDLVEAQSALVEVDRIGRLSSEVKAYDRYNNAVSRFLDRQLAKSLKRRKRNEFERSGFEARQDLFRVFSAFVPSHEIMANRLAVLADSINNFQAVDLTRIVATKTVTRVRSSLKKILTSINRGEFSKVSVAVELLSGAAALQSISNNRTVVDPLVETGEYPAGRDIKAYSEPVAAVATGDAGPVDISLLLPGNFVFVRDPKGANVVETATFPTGLYVAATRTDNAASFVIPFAGRTLYVQLDGLTPPDGSTVFVKTIPLTSGTRTVAQVAAEIDAALGVDAACEEWASSGRLIITAAAPVTKITVRDSFMGTMVLGGDGNYTFAVPDASVHETLGFSANQESHAENVYTAEALIDVLGVYVDGVELALEEGLPVIRSSSTALTSGLEFANPLAAAFGFAGTFVAEPSYLVLKENGVELDPSSLGIVAGSTVQVTDDLDSMRSLLDPITNIEGTHLLFEGDIARVDGADVVVTSQLVASAQAAISVASNFAGKFEDDVRRLNQVLSPLLSTPTLAQINDARRVLDGIQEMLTELREGLGDLVVPEDSNSFTEISRNILSSLEERGLDRAQDLLLQADFISFFGLTSETASKSSRLLKAAEEVARNELIVSSAEIDTPDYEIPGNNDLDIPDSNLTKDEGEF